VDGSCSDTAVRERYSAAAREVEPQLCCPVEYDPRYLEVVPPEVLERDYGCGDPSRYVRKGETVLDLGSGGGKICFIAAQIVGPEGRVIGVDSNDEMLSLSRGAAPQVGAELGYRNVEFRRGRIQDLALDLDLLDAWLREHPVRSLADLERMEEEASRLRRERPLIPDGSVDLVISNCVLNLVREEDKGRLFREIHRVLGAAGRLAISDIVSGAPVPRRLKQDPSLWSGCISGAFTQAGLLAAIDAAGFQKVAIDKREPKPFAVVEGIEFRSLTVTACKGGGDRCCCG